MYAAGAVFLRVALLTFSFLLCVLLEPAVYTQVCYGQQDSCNLLLFCVCVYVAVWKQKGCHTQLNTSISNTGIHSF